MIFAMNSIIQTLYSTGQVWFSFSNAYGEILEDIQRSIKMIKKKNKKTWNINKLFSHTQNLTYLFHFIDEDTEIQRLKRLPKLSELLRSSKQIILVLLIEYFCSVLQSGGSFCFSIKANWGTMYFHINSTDQAADKPTQEVWYGICGN